MFPKGNFMLNMMVLLIFPKNSFLHVKKPFEKRYNGENNNGPGLWQFSS